MNRYIVIILITALGLLSPAARAGNPDRQGEAGGYELLLNPWARSAGLHALNTSWVSCVEDMNINIAGLSRMYR